MTDLAVASSTPTNSASVQVGAEALGGGRLNRSAPSERSPFLDTAQAADYLGLKRHRLEAFRVSGAGPRFTKLGRAVRYRRDWLDSWADDNAVSSTAETRSRQPGATPASPIESASAQD